MKIGFLTNSLARFSDITSMAGWAKENGFEQLEIGPTVGLNVGEIGKAVQANGLEITSFIYCRNPLSPDKQDSELHRKNIKDRIDAAAALGVSFITTSTGINSDLSEEKNWGLFKEYILPVLEYAAGKGVSICIENCPDMNNLVHSPAAFERLFSEIPADNLKLALDPSHLIRLMADPYLAADQFADKVAYVHGKDTQIHRHRLAAMGIRTARGWWQYRLPGMGELNWSKFFSLLTAHGFDGVVSIEHEDPIWGGSEERVKTGLLKGKAYLEGLIKE